MEVTGGDGDQRADGEPGAPPPAAAADGGAPPLRYAEKNMPATCELADRIARAVIARYRELAAAAGVPVPRGDGGGGTAAQTVVAGFAVDFCSEGGGGEQGGGAELHVVAVASGTKFLPQALEDLGGARVRDCHAEVLARRALVRLLYDQVEAAASSGGRCEGGGSGASDLGGRLIVELSGTGGVAGGPPRYRLKAGVRLHLYTSSSPCGNACIRRWVHNRREVKREELGNLLAPPEPHDRISVHAAREGQVAVLVKGSPAGEGSEARGADASGVGTGNGSSWEGRGSCTLVIPPGTSAPGPGGGKATCSDKLARWGALGLQGALLSTLLEPVRAATLTVGRKFSRPHIARAVCCRLQDFTPDGVRAVQEAALERQLKRAAKRQRRTADMDVAPGAASDKKGEGGGGGGEEEAAVDAASVRAQIDAETSTLRNEGFGIAHPALMGTSVKLDHGVYVAAAAAGEGDGGELEGANFSDPRCLVWWHGREGGAEVLDGTTGLPAAAGAEGGWGEEGPTSGVSRASLFRRFWEVRARSVATGARAAPGGSLVPVHLSPESTTYGAAKRAAGPYQLARSILLRWPFFGGWPTQTGAAQEFVVSIV